MKTVFWFRRDRRLQDNEALSFAAHESSELYPLYVFPNDINSLTPLRQASVIESVKSLASSIPAGLNIAIGDAAEEIASFVKKSGIQRVVATRAYDTNGMLEQANVAEKLHSLGVSLNLVGSNYAIVPGTVRKDDGSPLRVYTPFYKRWSLLDWGNPFKLDITGVNWKKVSTLSIPAVQGKTPFPVKASEAFALRTDRKSVV